MSIFQRLAGDSLLWLPEHGIGYYPVKGEPYDKAYFDKYQGYAATLTGRALNRARKALVHRHWQGEVLDVGIGCGQFVESRPNTLGYDVNPAGLAWLGERGLYRDLYVGTHEAATFWDSLEHIADADAALARVSKWAFVSLPIFDGAEAVLRSKHYRKDEHYHYFTADGFVKWMAAQGFELREQNRMETELGREGIGSFAFERA